MHKRQIDRFRESRERREEAQAELERRLLAELWDTPSQVLDRPSRVHLPVEVGEQPPPRAALSPQAKQAITVAAMAIGTAIVSALTATGATKQHEPKPPITQPGP